jgi:hypothetical protein
MVEKSTLELIGRLSDSLATLMEINYLPEDCEAILPDGVAALREAKLIMGTHNHRITEQMVHWLGKVDAFRRH